ncbi:hypothetical protein [Mucilaginibacter psychrotolerans]|uniref:Lipocalin-like domain-containing protein n=1 Tax=Mucilaginibacter psychrotolerans TaxID=1524096 RepID=A0A4Y8SBV1_9SPHI|nr:hypothetical protein [Mucilaginibacter psychrotolerans]TFF36115.1 hypothetical protein E2R66_16330 [Mucilaginibacter psychrotolerans]
MKNLFFIPVFMIACVLFSCQKEAKVNPSAPVSFMASNKKTPVGTPVTTPVPVPSVPTIPVTDTVTSSLPVASIVTLGKWKVASYREGTSVSTSKFNGYTFVFDKSGAIVVDNNGQTTNGTWLYLTASFYYGIPTYGYSPYGFNILLGTKKPLSLLSKNLFISKKTTTNLYVDSVNPAEDTHVTLVKFSN